MVSKREAAIITAHTGFVLGEVVDAHRYIEEILERPVDLSEFAELEVLLEIRRKSMKDFSEIEVEK